MKLLKAIQKALPEEYLENAVDNTNLKHLYPNMNFETQEKIVYRKNGKSIEKIIEFDPKTGSKIKTTHYDYFNDKKIRSIDEYDRKSGKKIRTVNYVLYKSVDEYDIKTGKKIRTINYSVKDESKISSIQEYDIETGKITTITIYKRDGKTIGIIKKVDSTTEKVVNWINNNKNSYKPIEPEKFSTRNYDNIKLKEEEKEDINKLIDNLYCNNLKFDTI